MCDLPADDGPAALCCRRISDHENEGQQSHAQLQTLCLPHKALLVNAVFALMFIWGKGKEAIDT